MSLLDLENEAAASHNSDKLARYLATNYQQILMLYQRLRDNNINVCEPAHPARPESVLEDDDDHPEMSSQDVFVYTMNGKTYRCVLCYRLGVSLFSVSKSCSACSKVFMGDIYGDHVVSCAGIIDMLLYSWDGGLDVCMELTRSSPLTQTGMADFVSGRAVIDVAQRKRGKYMAKCAAIGYGFLPFSFSSLRELEPDAVTLMKQIRKFSMAQDIGIRAAVHIFNRISFSIAKGVGAQKVSWLPFNLL
nr:hypothetical protein [Tanacetum cinerariifolium]